MTELGREIWEEATQAGIRQGIEQGLEQGIEQGIEQERLRADQRMRDVVRKMFHKGNTAEDISDCTGLPLEEVQKIEAEELQQA